MAKNVSKILFNMNVECIKQKQKSLIQYFEMFSYSNLSIRNLFFFLYMAVLKFFINMNNKALSCIQNKTQQCQLSNKNNIIIESQILEYKACTVHKL